MIHRKIVKLEMTMKEAEHYNPPKGIDILWLEWDHTNKTVIAEFHGCDINPGNECNMGEIVSELAKLKVLENRTSHGKSPAKIMKVETILENVSQSIRNKAKNIHEVEIEEDNIKIPSLKGKAKSNRIVKGKKIYKFDMGMIDEG